MTNYQKVQAVHNWMIRNVKYDYYSLKRGYVPSVSHTAKGALLKKWQCVMVIRMPFRW